MRGRREVTLPLMQLKRSQQSTEKEKEKQKMHMQSVKANNIYSKVMTCEQKHEYVLNVLMISIKLYKY